MLILIPIIVVGTTLRKKKTLIKGDSIPQASFGREFTTPPAVVVPVPAKVSPEKNTTTPQMAPPLPTVHVVTIPGTLVSIPAIPIVGKDPSAEIRNRLLALNRPTAPWQIIDGRSEGVDLVAEWKIVDVQWKEIFSKAKLTKTFRIYIKFDPAKKEVRTLDKETTVQWQAGFPSFHAEASTFKGQQTSLSFGTGYAFTETLDSGRVYKYGFNSNEMKKPIQDAVKEAGWNYKGVAFGKL